MYKRSFAIGAAIGILTGLSAVLTSPPLALAIDYSDISITQDDRALTILVENPYGDPLKWQYTRGILAGECNENLSFELSEISTSQITGNQAILVITTPSSYCFKITNEAENEAAWRSYQPAPPADRTGPRISISPAAGFSNLLAVSSVDQDLDSASWRYASFEHNPNCADENVNTKPGGITSGRFSLVLKESDNGKWYCFKAQDTLKNVSYEKYLVEGIDATQPEVIIRQDGRLLVASLTENENVSWLHVFSPSDVNCNSGTFLNNRSARAGNQVTLTSDRINYYYCFQARDNAGNAGFAKYKVESVDFLTPEINLRKTNLTVMAESDRQVGSWHYLKTDAPIDCNGDADFVTAVDFSASEKIELGEADHQKYLCVRAVNVSNIAAYAKIQVDTRIPQVDLEINEQSITAAADKDDLRWRYLKTEAEPACDHSESEKFETVSEDRYEGSESRLNELDNGLWFCFQAADDEGNFGYAKAQVADIIAKAPGSDGERRGRTDIIVITAILILGVGGGIAYAIWKRPRTDEKEAEPLDTSKKALLKKAKKTSKSKRAEKLEETVIQPLDYLKKDDEEKEPD